MASIVLRSVERSLDSEEGRSAEWKALRDGGNEKFDDGQYTRACEQCSCSSPLRTRTVERWAKAKDVRGLRGSDGQEEGLTQRVKVRGR